MSATLASNIGLTVFMNCGAQKSAAVGVVDIAR